MNVIVDVRGMNVNMRVSDKSTRGVLTSERQRRSVICQRRVLARSAPGITWRK